jgi:hypothetical protein
VDAMLSEMTISEYVHWQAIYSVEPFPEDRADLRTAEQLRMTLITAGVKQLPTITDLIPDWWGDHKPREQTPEQIKSNIKLIKAATKRHKK